MLSREVAYVQPTAGTQHLLDVGEDNYTTEANNGVRVAYRDQSWLFFCDYEYDPSVLNRAEYPKFKAHGFH